MTVQATRRIQFCAGHRVHGHPNKCGHVHGHNYVALIHAEAVELDSLGMVVDFGVLKEKVGGWIDSNWDHGFVCCHADNEIMRMLGMFKASNGNKQKLFILPYNPTAENMADYLLHKVCPEVLDGTGVRVTKVTLWETENCFAEVSL